MVFSSLEFILIFLPLFLAAYYLLPDRYRNLCLLLFSLGFYAYGTRSIPEHFVLLMAMLCLNYLAGLLLGKYRCKWLLVLGMVLDFGVLLLFKYGSFLLTNLAAVLGVSSPDFQIALPLGISFYTFQMASYLIDVYRGAVSAEHSVLDFGVYVTMFPQLIAGPIVRYQDIRRRLRKRKYSLHAFAYGLSQFILGLGFKVLFANRIGGLWRNVCVIGFESVSTPLAWMGLLSCSLQLYFDFWGYSLMAIGLGRMIGFSLPINFLHPYQSRSMTEFWRRWHITLGSWFKEYVYIPLGGNRKGEGRTYRNLLIVWVFTGVWHGAGWNFMVWGIFLFAVIAIEKAGLLTVLSKHSLLSHLYMLLLIPLSWLLFSVTDIHNIATYLQRLIGLGGEAVYYKDYFKYTDQYGMLLAVGLLFCTPVPYRIWDRIKLPWATAILLAVILFTCIYYLYQGMNDPFLYLNF